MITPKDINQDSDNNNINVASFGYYDGIHVAKEKGLKQTTSFGDVFAGTHFIVCCGDVMMTVKDTDYPEIERRQI